MAKINAENITPDEAGLLLLAKYDAQGFDAKGWTNAAERLVGAGMIERNPTAPNFVRVTEDGEELLTELYEAHGFDEEDEE